MIKQFDREHGIAAGFASDKPIFIPNMLQLVEALTNFKFILMEKTRATTPDITLIELGSAGVTDETVAGNTAVELAPIPERGLATSTVTPTNLDINVTLDPKLGLLVLTKDGYTESFKVDCQFINWPFDGAAFASLPTAPTESLTPIDPLPTPAPTAVNHVYPGGQFISIESIINGAEIDSIPNTVTVKAYDSSQIAFVKLFINGELIGQKVASDAVDSLFTFNTEASNSYALYLTGKEYLSNELQYYAVLIGAGGNISSSTKTVRFSKSFIPPDDPQSGGTVRNRVFVTTSISGSVGVSGTSVTILVATTFTDDGEFYRSGTGSASFSATSSASGTSSTGGSVLGFGNGG